ncbi:hypothetical protein [uncultured Piscinibacter sp.]|uniref:hypothetical protein n=1 Tax=uncultured Piscinibacter sp. TaxID=1131835 RepID=UPI0026167357|nr:hypothetical protein [uncultured Piscinibacter sp.]
MPSRKPTTGPQATRSAQWMSGLFKRPLKIERRGVQLHLVFGEAPKDVSATSTSASAGEALRRGHEELRALLRRHPEARHLMRHLGYIEQQLACFGSRALRQEVPVPVLAKGLEQLDLLARDEPSEALSELRRRIASAIARRSPAAADEDTETRPGSLEVTEASHSLFDEMERSWIGQMPVVEPGPAGRD